MDPSEPRISPIGDPAPRTLAREAGRNGELALRARGEHFEIVSNGVFLMDTHDGRSERLLVRAALDAGAPTGAGRLLLGGLGVGFSLAEAVADRRVGEVVVVECEPAVVAWNRLWTGPLTGGSVDRPRVRCEIADLVAWLRRPPDEPFDAICLDVDNGPDWTVTPANAWLYDHAGLSALRARLAPGGVLAVWSAAPVLAFEDRLRQRFALVRRVEVPVARGAPDVVYLASRGRSAGTIQASRRRACPSR